jgi:ribosomal protein S18 acetylase RimI-like enzyme
MLNIGANSIGVSDNLESRSVAPEQVGTAHTEGKILHEVSPPDIGFSISPRNSRVPQTNTLLNNKGLSHKTHPFASLILSAVPMSSRPCSHPFYDYLPAASSMSDSVQIREAMFPADKTVVGKLFLAYASSLPINLDFQGFEGELANLPGKYAQEMGGHVYLAFKTPESPSMSHELLLQNEDAIGVVGLRRFSTTNTIPTCELKRLYVAPDCRGLGVSKMLMDVALRKARNMGYHEILLDTLSSMTPARRLYQSYGFEQIDKYYESVEDAVFYKKSLEG